MNDRRPAVFFDRDGTLNEEVEFLSTPLQLRLIPGAAAAVRSINATGLVACVISNQSGVARGLFTEAALIPIHEKLARELGAGGAHLDGIYYCPHHPTEGIPPYNVSCDCRKPSSGMLQQAEAEFGIDLSRSFVVGDRIVDVQAGQSVGAKGILVLTGYGRQAREECRRMGVNPDFIAESVTDAVAYILQQHKGDTTEHD